MPPQNNLIDISNQLLDRRWSTRLDTAVDDNADDAAAAANLAEETGGDANAIHENLETAQRNYKQHLSNSIVASDPYLQRYINSHELAAKISNDDWGNLATAGESYRKVAASTGRPWWEVGAAGVARGIQSGGGELISGLGRMMGSPRLSAIGKRLMDSIDTNVPLSEEDQNRISAQVGEGLGQMLSLLPTGVVGGVPGAALTMGVQTGEQEAEKAEKAGKPEEAANVFTGGFAVGTGLGMLPLGALQKVGGAKLGEGIFNWAAQNLKEAAKTGLTFAGVGELGQAASALLESETFDPSAKYSPDIHRMVSNLALGSILGPSFGLVKPYIDAGEPVPPGVHPLMDKLIFEKTKVDNKALDEALKDAAKTSTQELSPKFLKRYYKMNPHASMALDGAKVVELYGDRSPEPDDNILGWVPNIQAQLDAARRGGDITIPLADYVAHIDPKVDKELHDFRMVDPDGLTLDDAKNLAAGAAPGDQEQEVPGKVGAFKASPVPVLDAVRKQTGMDKILPESDLSENHLEGDTPGPGILPADYDPKAKQVKSLHTGETYTINREYNARDLLKNVDANLFKDRASKALYQFFGDRLANTVGDQKVTILSDKELNKLHSMLGGIGYSNAFHWGSRGGDDPIIAINESTASGLHGRMYAAHALVHELAHAASVKYMMEHPELGGQVVKLRDETLKWVQGNKPDLLDHPGVSYGLGVTDNLGRRFDKPGREFVAQTYSEPDFQDLLAEVPISKELANEIGRPQAKSVWEAARHIVKKAFDAIFKKPMPPTALDAMFTLGQKFEAAHTKDPSLKTTEPFTEEREIPTPEERQLFRDQKTLGYTKDHWERIKTKIAQQKAEDQEWHRKQIEKEAAERQTELWKKNEEEARPDVMRKVYQRPDIAADRFFRLGIWQGSKVTRQRIANKYLSEDERSQISTEHRGKTGLNPDEIAPAFGYRSGQAMINDLAALEGERQREGLTPDAHVKDLVERELQRMMKAKFGSLEQQILEDAKDHIINDGQFNLLSEDSLRLATKYGMAGVPWTKDDIKRMARADLKDGMTVGDLKSTRLADKTGKIGRQIEDAENKGDAQTVMKLAQDREVSFYKTIEARKFEKLQSQVQKVMRRHRQLEPAGFKDTESAAYHDFIQILMGEAKQAIGKRRLDQVKQEVVEKGFKDLRDFVQDRELHKDETIPAPDFILDRQHLKDLDDYTVGEAESYYNLIKSLDKLGREAFKFNRRGEAIDLAPVKNQMIDELERFPLVEREETKGRMSKFDDLFHYYDAALRNNERLLNRFDRDNPRGPWNQFINRTATEAANRKEAILRKYGGKLRELGEPPDLKKTFDPPIKVPSTGKSLTRFTNKNKLAIMLNMGSVENWTKFTNGWKVDPDVLEQWIMQNSTKEEWKWVNGVWKIFGQMKKELDVEYRDSTGTPPADKAFRVVNTPDGPLEGGYYPLVHDEIEIGKGSRTATSQVGNGPSFFQASVPNPHAKPVTGAEYPVSMDLDHLPEKVQQIVHDIAFRQPVHEMKKILGDKQIRQAIRNHYGKQYDQSIDDWLKFISHSAETNSAASREGERVSDFFRQNTISYLVGFNIGTVLKHGPTALISSARQVGPDRLLKAYATLFKANPDTGDSMWTWAINNSEELQRRERYWQETFGGVYKDFTKSTLREHIIQWGAKPVAFSDKLSAVPMWIAAFEKARDDGMDFGESRFEADRAVRFAHGSTAQTNLPQIARSPGIHAWMTSLYGFFGTMMQNRNELAFKVNDAYKLGREGELAKAAKMIPLIAADTFAYVVWPTVVEEYVTGLWSDDRRGWGQRIAWATAGGLASSAIYARDLVHGLEYGLDTSGGMLGSAIRPFANAVNDTSDVIKGKWSRQRAGKLIDDIISVAGPAYGVPKEVGNLARYGWDTLVANQERPRTGFMKNWFQYGDLGMGLTRGTQKYTVRK